MDPHDEVVRQCLFGIEHDITGLIRSAGLQPMLDRPHEPWSLESPVVLVVLALAGLDYAKKIRDCP